MVKNPTVHLENRGGGGSTYTRVRKVIELCYQVPFETACSIKTSLTSQRPISLPSLITEMMSP